MARPTRFLILPAQGLQASVGVASAAATTTLTDLAHRAGVASMRTQLQRVVKAGAKAGAKPKAAAFNLVASLNEDGVKLVESTKEMMAALRFEQPGLRIVPEVFYRPAVWVARILHRPAKPAGVAAAAEKKLVVTVVNADTGDPVAGVTVVGFTDFDARTGTQGTTTSTGKVTLTVTGSTTYERVYAQHDHPGLWSFLGRNVPTNGALTIELDTIDLSVTDSLRHFHTIGGDVAVGTGVKVGVIDSGVDGNHADLVVAGGLGCVPQSPENEFGPSGSHGTHVAGIIAGRGAAPTGMRGIAPGASIFSYRVFDDTVNSGSSFGLVKAIRRGIEDKCDLLNMSLSFDHDENSGLSIVDDAVKDAIAEAHAAGVVVIAAAGNHGRMPVSYPAMDDLAVAVSAVGRKQTFPTKSSESGDVVAPFGTDTKNFLAAFSNVGTALDAAAAGVGVVSTVPGGHAPMSGTSMACPAVTGVLARLLASSPAVLNLARNANRADAIKDLLFAQAQSLGLGVANEGKGLPE
jgi:subtilisin